MADTFHPLPYQSKSLSELHRGLVQSTTSGTALIDLGIGHNNFVPVIQIKGGATEEALDLMLDWAYGTKPGSFTVLVYKRPGSYGAWIPDTAARTLGFIAVAGDSVSPL